MPRSQFSQPPRSSQLPPSPAGSARLRRIRRPPDKLGDWISDYNLSDDFLVTGREFVVTEGGAADQIQLGGGV